MCIFCDIIEGKIPSKKVYEDDDFLAILDLSQTTKGHTLVMPKKHYDNFLEMNENDFGQLMSKVNSLTNDLLKSLNANGCNILINTNEVAGQTINHTHVHIIPRYDQNDSISIKFKENEFNLDDILNEIRDGK